MRDSGLAVHGPLLTVNGPPGTLNPQPPIPNFQSRKSTWSTKPWWVFININTLAF